MRGLQADIEAILDEIQIVKASGKFTPPGLRDEMDTRWKNAPIPIPASSTRKLGTEMRLERLGKAGVVADLKEDRAFWTTIVGSVKSEVAEAANMAVDVLDDPIVRQSAC